MKKTTSPRITPEFISWLENIFPDRLPRDLVDPRQYDRLVGQQDVIRRIRREHELQNENLLRS